MSSQLERDHGDYHLRLMIERLQREGRSEAAITDAVRVASGSRRPGGRPAERDHDQRRGSALHGRPLRDVEQRPPGPALAEALSGPGAGQACGSGGRTVESCTSSSSRR